MSKVSKNVILVKMLIVFVLFLSITSLITAEEVITIKWGHINAPGDSTYAAPNYFAEKVEELSGGKIKVEVFPAGQLGAERDLVESVKLGTIQISSPALGVISLSDPRMTVLHLPFLLKNENHFIKVLNSDIGKKLESAFQEKTGLKILDYFVESPHGLFNDDLPVWTPKDVKGRKVRIMESELIRDTWEALGAIPVPIPGTELYTALSTGVVEMADSGIDWFYSQKLYEVAQYFSMVDHMMMSSVLIINAEFFENLPLEYQEIIQEVISEAAEIQRIENMETKQRKIDAVMAEGAKVHFVNKEAFKEKMAPVYDKWKKELGVDFVEDFIKSVEEFEQ